jgi:hypothetical protein
MSKTATRRHHTARLKRQRAHHHGGHAGSDPRHLGKVVATATPCSCPMCGNPRRHEGARSVQEVSAAQFARLFT